MNVWGFQNKQKNITLDVVSDKEERKLSCIETSNAKFIVGFNFSAKTNRSIVPSVSWFKRLHLIQKRVS